MHHIHAKACRGQTKVLDPLELDLLLVMSHYVGAEHQTRSSLRIVSPLDH